MSSLVFGTQSTKQVQLDHTKPLVIPAGLDSLQNIGKLSISGYIACFYHPLPLCVLGIGSLLIFFIRIQYFFTSMVDKF